jgi:hypothetical protein
VGLNDMPTLLTWESPRHELKYPYPGAPAGAERATDFFVNGFLRMTFNPRPDEAVLPSLVEMKYSLEKTASSISAPAASPTRVNNVGFDIIGLTSYSSDLSNYFYTLAPTSPQVVEFPVIQAPANLGQTVHLRVVFSKIRTDFPQSPILDVTFTGALVSSTPI